MSTEKGRYRNVDLWKTKAEEYLADSSSNMMAHGDAREGK
jgi:hypothetical protein